MLDGSVDRVQQQTAEHVVDDERREKLTAKDGVTGTPGSGSQTSELYPAFPPDLWEKVLEDMRVWRKQGQQLVERGLLKELPEEFVGRTR